jgi:phosphoribosylamine--glycine ligase
MRVLIVGAGGREHALAWRLLQGASVTELHAAPGSAAIARLGRCHQVAADDIAGQVALAQRIGAELVVVGPEVPLVLGLADALRAVGIATVGPGAAAAQLEGSKAFAKELMIAAGVPTAEHGAFDSAASALAYIDAGSGPIVVKADGLAAGKGVTVCADRSEAAAAVRACFEGRFGAAGSRVLIEEFLTGTELSFIALCDESGIVPLASSQDHKRLKDGDLGPNTGGMGAFSPSPICDAALSARVIDEVIKPILAELARRGIGYRGFLYAGLMIDGDQFKVLEFNVRCGDPETQVLMARLEGDLGLWLHATGRGELRLLIEGYGAGLGWRDGAAVGVTLASRGYPQSSEAGVAISGVDEVGEAVVFHAGTGAGCGGWETAGGRVLTVCAIGADLDEAAARAYAAVAQIRFDGMQYRSDIGRGPQKEC